MPLELLLRPENQPAHRRMQPIRADDQIAVARGAALEGDVDALLARLDAGDAVAEDGLDLALDLPIDRRGEVAPCKADVAPVGEGLHDFA